MIINIFNSNITKLTLKIVKSWHPFKYMIKKPIVANNAFFSRISTLAYVNSIEIQHL